MSTNKAHPGGRRDQHASKHESMERTSRRKLLKRGGAGLLGAVISQALPRTSQASTGPASGYGVQVPVAWFDLALDLVKRTPGFSPPVASRAFAYLGITLYEAIWPGMPGYLSLAGKVNGLTVPTEPPNPLLHWPSVANAALAIMSRGLFPTAPASEHAAIDALEAQFANQFATAFPPIPAAVLDLSIRRGRIIAAHIFEWSRTDGGHEGYLRNFPTDYVPPTGPGLWVPTPPAFSRALQPYWGNNRTFALSSGAQFDPGPPTPYSEQVPSHFYADAFETYDVSLHLTPEQEAIARFWSDDPGTTATPPGHSVSILTQVLLQTGANLAKAAEAYAKVGMAVSDAFVSCWDCKYRYNLVRPVTYIRKLIAPNWTPLLGTPPFPEYTSGHSVQSGAAAKVLTDLFGSVTFIDHTHDDRGLAPRAFSSFNAAAQEAAISRLYGGIHFRPAIDIGVDQGEVVGGVVSALKFKAL